MNSKKLYNYFFLKNGIILPPVIDSTEKRARKQLIKKNMEEQINEKVRLIHKTKFRSHYSIAL